MKRCRRATATACLLALTSSHSAGAQSAGSAEAEELFQQGRAALGAHEYPLACFKFVSSLRLEPAVGTLMSLAECEEAQNQLASARQHWQEAADLADARNDPLHRGAFGRERFAAVDVRVPRLLVRLAPGAPKSATLQRDDVALGAAGFGSELPLDPGPHVLAVAADGHEVNRYPIELVEGEHTEISVEPGAAEDTAAPSLPERTAGLPVEAQGTATSQSPPSTVAAANAATSPRAPPSPQRLAAYFVGGLGLAGIAVGSYFGLNAFAKWDSAQSQCSSGCADNSTGRRALDDARSSATVSTVAFSIGGASLAAAAVLWLTASPPKREKTAYLTFVPVVTLQTAGVGFGGVW